MQKRELKGEKKEIKGWKGGREREKNGGYMKKERVKVGEEMWRRRKGGIKGRNEVRKSEGEEKDLR